MSRRVRSGEAAKLVLGFVNLIVAAQEKKTAATDSARKEARK